jgi:acyl carrier protein
MVASFGDRPVAEVSERIDSIQLAWLVHQVEQRYGVEIELDDGQFGRMSTVTGAVEVLREAVLVVEDA